ncbi:MAG: ATP-binding protein [Acidobacteriota bacterium]
MTLANYRVRFVRSFALLGRLYASLADDSFEDVLDELCKPDLLIIDELGNSPRKHEHDYTGVFFELVARRYRYGSIIIIPTSASTSGIRPSAPPVR